MTESGKIDIAALRDRLETEGGLNPELESIWEACARARTGYALTLDQIPLSRQSYTSQLISVDKLRRGGDVDVEELSIPANDGADLPAIILRPTRASETSRPCIYYIANGGKHVQDRLVGIHTSLEADWVADLDLVFVSLAPRPGPEHRHPTQVEDAYAGLLWIAEHAEQLGIDPARIIISGKSGGGGIAAATALYARDQGGPKLTHQILVCPMLDDREITVSSKYEASVWDRQSNRTGWTAILGDEVGGADVSPYAAPARATDVGRLPATYLDCGSSEVFRDEILIYGLRLAQAGVPTELHCWAGAFHGFDSIAADTQITKDAVAARTSYLRRALKQQVTKIPEY